MAESELNDFLKDEEAEPEAAAVVAEPVAAAVEPEAAEAAAEPEATPTPGDSRTVPLAALEAVRRDHKERAARLEGELSEVRRQLEEARKPPAQPAAQPQPIDPSVDPQGFVGRVQEVMLNERLNTSEAMAVEKFGEAEVEAAKNDFIAAMKVDPTLQAKLYAQSHPYAWMMKQVQAVRLQRDIGDDPAAYRERVRAELQAEMGGAPEAERPAARLPPPSLANARSAAPRSAPAFTGPEALSDILPRG